MGLSLGFPNLHPHPTQIEFKLKKLNSSSIRVMKMFVHPSKHRIGLGSGRVKPTCSSYTPNELGSLANNYELVQSFMNLDVLYQSILSFENQIG